MEEQWLGNMKLADMVEEITSRAQRDWELGPSTYDEVTTAQGAAQIANDVGYQLYLIPRPPSRRK